MKFNWCAEFVEAASGNTADPAEQLTPLAATRWQLIEQLASANAMPRTPQVAAYIAEIKRRLRALP